VERRAWLPPAAPAAEGADRYDTADRTALAYLAGYDCVPVHRNKGIDAVLVEQFRDRPIPVRVQRNHESVREAAALLERAARGKHAELMILVVTETRPAESRVLALPPKMVAVESASTQIARALGKSDRRNSRSVLFETSA